MYSLLYNSTRFSIICLLSFTIIFLIFNTKHNYLTIYPYHSHPYRFCHILFLFQIITVPSPPPKCRTQNSYSKSLIIEMRNSTVLLLIDRIYHNILFTNHINTASNTLLRDCKNKSKAC